MNERDWLLFLVFFLDFLFFLGSYFEEYCDLEGVV